MGVVLVGVVPDLLDFLSPCYALEMSVPYMDVQAC